MKPEVFKRKPIGGLHLATPSEQEIIALWAEAFSLEAFGRRISKEEAHETARRNIEEKRVYMWLIPIPDASGIGAASPRELGNCFSPRMKERVFSPRGKEKECSPRGMEKEEEKEQGEKEEKENSGDNVRGGNSKEKEKAKESSDDDDDDDDDDETSSEEGEEGESSSDSDSETDDENEDEDDGTSVGGREAVAMAMFSKETRNGKTIGWVYTPPLRRKQGYGSGIVAAMSRLALDRGASFCLLFTDSSNPTSNHIYRDIGYAHLCQFLHYKKY